MRDCFFKFKSPFYLCFIGLVWIFILNFFLQIFSQDYVYADTASYIRAAEDFYFNFRPNDIRPSLIAAINGLPLLFGYTKETLFLWNTIVNLIVWFGTVLLIYKFCLAFLSKKGAFFVALLYVFSLGSLLIVFEFLSETLFTFFLLSGLVFLQKYINVKGTLYLALSFVALILSMLIKPASLLLLVGICFFVGYKAIIKLMKSQWSVMVYLALSIVGTHMYLMKLNYGNFTLSYIDSFTYYNYLGTKADCIKKGTKFIQCDNDRYRYFNKFSLPEGKKVAFEDIKKQLSDNTVNFIIAYCSNIVGNSSKASGYFYIYDNKNQSSIFETSKVIFRGLSRLQCLFYSIIGLFLSIKIIIRRNTSKIMRCTAVIILYIIAISGISSDQGDRFHIVIYPFVLLLIAYYLSNSPKPIFAPLQK